MREYLQTILAGSGSLAATDILLRLLAAAVLGGVIFLSYWFTHRGVVYSRKFNVSLATLTLLTGTVMTVIGNNVALSLGMVGALSIVRFRTAIKDSRDTMYIFWAVIAGICCGVGDYLVAFAGAAAVFLLLLLFGAVRSENRILLILRGSGAKAAEMEGVVFRCFGGKALLKVKNTTPEAVELIYEMPRQVYRLAEKQAEPVADKLYALGGVEYVNIVAQSDEITG